MTKRTLGYSYPIALTISLVPALTPAIVQAAPLTPPPATGILDGLCYDYVPKIEKLAPGKDANAQPVEVDADRLEEGGTAVYQGDVKVRQGVRKFDSDYAELDQKSRDVIAIGNIYYNDGQITVTSDKTLKSNLNTKNSELEEGKYQVHGSPVRGSADRVTMTNNNQNITLEGAQYTTCPPGQEVWTLKAGSIDIDQTEVFGEAWNASLWLYDYPVFYFPYINFPIKDERKTGLLYPGYTQSSKNGMDITQPFYWNIAPNYDATITSRFMDRRGLMEQVEFRYMPDPAHVGSLYFENLANDKQYDETPSLNDYLSDGHRYLLNARHTSMFMDNAMRVSVDYTKVRDRDYNYFNDFSPKVGTQVDNQLQQSLMAGYFQPNWNINTEVRTYQILLASAQQPHELMPRIDHNYYQQGSWYDLAWNTEITKFGYNNAQAIAQNQGSAYTGTRVYTAPTLTMPLIDEAGYYLDSQYKLMYTRYDQEVPDNMSQTFVSRFTPAGANGVTLDEGIITRTLPSFRLKGGMTFERNQNWFGGNANQTLEPEFQYLYVPYKDQDNIGVYDSTSMRQDYYSLFSDRRYAGLDRISDSNRLSVGVTSRVYDEAGDERIRLAVAQAFDFVAPRVKLYPSDALTTNTRSPLSFEGDAKINEQWFAHAGAQYDVDQSRFSSANSAVEYRREKLISQLNHRFVRDANLVPNTNNEVTDLNQIGLLLTTPLNDQWHLYGGYYQELNQSVKSDRKVGLKYDSCCWSINFNLEWVNTPNNVNNTSTAERSFGIQFEMKGLGSVGTGSKGTSLDTEALPYIRPFNLRDQ